MRTIRLPVPSFSLSEHNVSLHCLRKQVLTGFFALLDQAWLLNSGSVCTGRLWPDAEGTEWAAWTDLVVCLVLIACHMRFAWHLAKARI